MASRDDFLGITEVLFRHTMKSMVWQLLFGICVASVSDSPAEAAIAGSTAYIPAPPQVLGQAAEDKFSLSPTGDFVAWASTSVPGRNGGKPGRHIVVTDLSSGSTQGLALDVKEEWTAHWGLSRRLWVLLEPVEEPESQRTLLSMQAGRPDSLKLIRLDPTQYGEDLTLFTLPNQKGAVLLGQKVTELQGGSLKEEWILSRLNEEGQVLASAVHQRQSTGPLSHFFTQDGKALILKVNRRGGGAELAQIGVDDLALSFVPNSTYADGPAKPEPTLSLEKREGWLWLKGGSASARLTPSTGAADLASSFERVLYLSEGHLFSREILTTTADKLLTQRYAEARAKTERSARDVGRALRLAWAEGGMSYPAKAEALKTLGRLVRWDESLDDLVIDFAGGPLPRGVDSARTPYGSITNLYGRAVIFLDGTVAWTDGRPS
jgi:hypothetical protein